MQLHHLNPLKLSFGCFLQLNHLNKKILDEMHKYNHKANFRKEEEIFQDQIFATKNKQNRWNHIMF